MYQKLLNTVSHILRNYRATRATILPFQRDVPFGQTSRSVDFLARSLRVKRQQPAKHVVAENLLKILPPPFVVLPRQVFFFSYISIVVMLAKTKFPCMTIKPKRDAANATFITNATKTTVIAPPCCLNSSLSCGDVLPALSLSSTSLKNCTKSLSKHIASKVVPINV